MRDLAVAADDLADEFLRSRGGRRGNRLLHHENAARGERLALVALVVVELHRRLHVFGDIVHRAAEHGYHGLPEQLARAVVFVLVVLRTPPERRDGVALRGRNRGCGKVPLLRIFAAGSGYGGTVLSLQLNLREAHEFLKLIVFR